MNNPELFCKNVTAMRNIAKMISKKHEGLLTWSVEPESILEIGVGDGSTTKEIFFSIMPTDIKEYVGCDVSQVMLEEAEKTITHPMFRAVQMDISSNNVPPIFIDRFDHIFSNYLFHMLRDVRQPFINIYKMLKPGGQLFFNTFEINPMDDAFELLDKGKWAKYNNSRSLSPFHNSENPLEEYMELIKNLGFRNVHIFSENHTGTFDEKTFNALMESVNQRLCFVADHDKTEYLKDFLDAVKKGRFVEYFPDQNKILLTVDVLTGVISKL